MALARCVECGKEISTEAKTCPSCGKLNPTTVPLPPKQPSRTRKVFLGIFGVAVAAVLIESQTIGKQGAPEPSYRLTEAAAAMADCSPPPSHHSQSAAGAVFYYAAASRHDDGSVTVCGRTALPEGAKVMLDLKGPGLRLAQTHAVVGRNGVFSVSDFKNGDKALSTGRYTLETVSYFNGAWQSSTVLAVTGENGSKLSTAGLAPDDKEFPAAGHHLDTTVAISISPLPPAARAIEAVKSATLNVVGSGKSSMSVGESVQWFAKAPGFAPQQWSAEHREKEWVVTLICIDEGQQKRPQWSYNEATGAVKYLDPLSKSLSYVPKD
jgi:hypothetical protein